MPSKETVGRNIKAARKKRGMTQREVFESSGLSISQISAFENARQMPGLSALGKLAKALKVSLDSLYFGPENERFFLEPDNDGEKIVNCLMVLHELGVISSVRGHEDYEDLRGIGSGYATVNISDYWRPIVSLFAGLEDYKKRKAFYPDGDSHIKALRASVANEINDLKEKSLDIPF